MTPLEEFVAAMRVHLPEDARIMLCQFPGDPAADTRGKWRAYVLNDCGIVNERANVYLCVSAMRRNARGEFRRRKENFAGGLLLMIDDLGTKFPLSTIDCAPPTALIETSPGNHQAVYMFDSLVTDMLLFEALIKAFIAAQFLGHDPGMAGVNRVFRPPAGVNGKAKYRTDAGAWHVRLADWRPERRYSVEALAQAFKLDLRRAGPRVPHGATADKAANIRAFVLVRAALRSAGMLKRSEPDMAGWSDVRCPWMDEHTGAANNGAAIRLPDEENAWFGAFKCHHGSCQERGWRELTQWLAEAQDEVLAWTNKHAPTWEDFE